MGFTNAIISEHIATVFLSTALSAMSVASVSFVLQDGHPVHEFEKEEVDETMLGLYAQFIS